MSRQRLQLSPTSPSTFLLLAALIDMPANPYSLILRVQMLSMGSVILGKSTIYAALKALERDGLVSSFDDPTRKGSKVFELAKPGRRALKQSAVLYESVSRQVLHQVD